MFDQLQAIQDEFADLQLSEKSLMAKNLLLRDQVAEAQQEAQQAKTMAANFEQQASKYINVTNQASRLGYDLENEKLETKRLREELAKLKGGDNPKKLKEQIKRVKDKNHELTKANNQLKVDNRDYRKESKEFRQIIDRQSARLVESGYLFKEIGGYQLMIFPSMMGVSRNGKFEKLIALLCMSPCGVGVMLTVDNGNLCYPNEYHAIENNEPIPKEVKDFAQMWLSKVEAQGYKYSDADLLVFGDVEDIEKLRIREKRKL